MTKEFYYLYANTDLAELLSASEQIIIIKKYLWARYSDTMRQHITPYMEMWAKAKDRVDYYSIKQIFLDIDQNLIFEMERNTTSRYPKLTLTYKGKDISEVLSDYWNG